MLILQAPFKIVADNILYFFFKKIRLKQTLFSQKINKKKECHLDDSQDMANLIFKENKTECRKIKQEVQEGLNCLSACYSLIY